MTLKVSSKGKQAWCDPRKWRSAPHKGRPGASQRLPALRASEKGHPSVFGSWWLWRIHDGSTTTRVAGDGGTIVGWWSDARYRVFAVEEVDGDKDARKETMRVREKSWED
ncbi:hypothetical protein LR48_Vigan10g185900 [Vigna angularis]|uniref:Uncharacterized protein n=1 Tax=Phaseolus angularis TaxID=3914 RepID=A0A0L9VM64_PHAAN|nr:hypothetical protein LR48_Vigan10g185900 [Vigna angularis]